MSTAHAIEVEILSADAIRERKQQLEATLGAGIEELRAKAHDYLLSLEQLEQLKELERLEFLAGSDYESV